MKRIVLLSVARRLAVLAGGSARRSRSADPAVTHPRLKGPEPFTRETPAPPMQRQITDDVRRRRNYPDQPPLIPHSIEGYALDLNANKCLSCHSRKFTEQSQAPMISVTHYQDRDGNFLGGVAPRRYACLACHVPQTTARAAGREPVHRHGCPGRARAAGPLTWRPSRSRTRSGIRGVGRLVPPGLHAGADPQPRLPDPRRLRRRRVLLGRLQHRPGGDQHGDVLRQLPRDEDQRLRGAEGHDPLHQPLGRARHLPGLPRAARVDEQDRPQDAGLEGGLGAHLRLHRHPREVPGACASTSPSASGSA